MATKQTAKTAKTAAPKAAPKAEAERYYRGVGRRKTAIVEARLYQVKDAKDAVILVNDRSAETYFGTIAQQNLIHASLKSVGKEAEFRVSLHARGGGLSGQADAARLAIARAIIAWQAELRPLLKANKLLVRDAREVERKKPGLKKARRSPQWSKR